MVGICCTKQENGITGELLFGSGMVAAEGERSARFARELQKAGRTHIESDFKSMPHFHLRQ